MYFDIFLFISSLTIIYIEEERKRKGLFFWRKLTHCARHTRHHYHHPTDFPQPYDWKSSMAWQLWHFLGWAVWPPHMHCHFRTVYAGDPAWSSPDFDFPTPPCLQIQSHSVCAIPTHSQAGRGNSLYKNLPACRISSQQSCAAWQRTQEVPTIYPLSKLYEESERGNDGRA